jgi:NADH-quinone oxidoreductase subunit M
MPVYATFFMIATLSSIAVPGTNGFVGEFMILVGAFRSMPVYAIFAPTGAILGALYMLWMYQRVMFSPLDKEENKNLKDLNWREIVTLLPLAVLVFVMGFFPGYFIHKMDATCEQFLKTYQQKVAMYEQGLDGGRQIKTVLEEKGLKAASRLD